MSEVRRLRVFNENTGKDVLTGFGKEVHCFEWKHGYRFDPKTKRMLPPSELKGRKFPTLTQLEEHKIVD